MSDSISTNYSVLRNAVLHREPFNGRCFQILYFGKRFGHNSAANWSLRGISLTHTNAELAERLQVICEELELSGIFAPTPSFNANHSHWNRLIHAIEIAPRKYVYRNPTEPADVITISPNQAMMISPGNCTIMVARNNISKNLVVAHLSRNGCIDMGEIMCNKPSLLNGGVVYTVLQTLGVTSDPSNLQVWLYGAPNRFFHPQNGDLKEVNDKIYKWVLERVGKDHPQLPSILPLEEKGFSLNLPHLAAAQLAGVGVPPNNIHLDDAYWKNEELVWLEGRPGAPRNLCIVVNRFAY